MIPKPNNRSQTSLFSSFEDILYTKHPLYILANKVDWSIFEETFSPFYQNLVATRKLDLY
jgi:IS5 family transposase